MNNNFEPFICVWSE